MIRPPPRTAAAAALLAASVAIASFGALVQCASTPPPGPTDASPPPGVDAAPPVEDATTVAIGDEANVRDAAADALELDAGDDTLPLL